MMKISIITPAYDHKFCRLRDMFHILQPQMQKTDEHLIYTDGSFPEAWDWALEMNDDRIKVVGTKQTRQNGNAQREQAMHDASGDVLYFLDDSMLPFPNALETIRNSCVPDRPNFYRIYYATIPNLLKWTNHEWQLGTHNVVPMMLVCPNDKQRLGSWHLADNVDTQNSPYGYPSPKGYESARAGGYFVDATVRNYPAGPVWHPEFISVWFE